MSRLFDSIRTRGFVVVVSPPRNEAAMVAAAFAAGADACKVHLNVTHRASGTRFGSYDEERASIEACIRANDDPGPVGVMPGADVTASRAEMERLFDAGIDFFDVYDHHCPAWMLALPMCAMVAVGPDHTSDQVRALARLGMDVLEASIVQPDDYGKPLTVRDLERYWLLCQATDHPVVVPSQKRLTPEDLPLLRETGVRGVILGTISLGDSAETIAERLPAFISHVR